MKDKKLCPTCKSDWIYTRDSDNNPLSYSCFPPYVRTCTNSNCLRQEKRSSMSSDVPWDWKLTIPSNLAKNPSTMEEVKCQAKTKTTKKK